MNNLNKFQLKRSKSDQSTSLNTELTFLRKNRNKEAIKNILKEGLYNSLSQAIIRILLTPHITLKVFLLLCVLGTVGYASFLVTQSIMTYFSYSVLTTSRINSFSQSNILQLEWINNAIRLQFKPGRIR